MSTVRGPPPPGIRADHGSQRRDRSSDEIAARESPRPDRGSDDTERYQHRCAVPRTGTAGARAMWCRIEVSSSQRPAPRLAPAISMRNDHATIRGRPRSPVSSRERLRPAVRRARRGELCRSGHVGAGDSSADHMRTTPNPTRARRTTTRPRRWLQVGARCLRWIPLCGWRCVLPFDRLKLTVGWRVVTVRRCRFGLRPSWLVPRGAVRRYRGADGLVRGFAGGRSGVGPRPWRRCNRRHCVCRVFDGRGGDRCGDGPRRRARSSSCAVRGLRPVAGSPFGRWDRRRDRWRDRARRHGRRHPCALRVRGAEIPGVPPGRLGRASSSGW